jgi:type I restriction enzyme, S subunit
VTASLRRFARHIVTKDVPGERPLINLESVEGGTGSLHLNADLPLSAAGQNLAAEPGDVLFAKLRPYLRKSLLVTEEVFASGEFLCLRPNGQVLDSRWLLHVTQSEPWVERSMASAYGAKMPRTSWDEMADFVLDPPSLEEQRRVADFLDEEVARVEEAVRLREQQVDALERRFRSFAAEAVSRESPRRVPLRRVLAAIRTGSTPVGPPVETADAAAVGWFTPDSFGEFGLLGKPRRYYGTDPGVTVFPARAVLFVGIGWASGRVAYLDEPGAGNQQLTALSANPHRMLSRFLLWQMYVLGPTLRRNAPFTVIPVLSNDYLKSSLVSVPPLVTQKAVTAAIDSEAVRLAAVRAEMREQVALLQERKRSLITAAVTGELDVTTARGVV